MLIPVHSLVDNYSQDAMIFHHGYFFGTYPYFYLGFSANSRFSSVNQQGFGFISGYGEFVFVCTVFVAFWSRASAVFGVLLFVRITQSLA
jgi:hypothetical protein